MFRLTRLYSFFASAYLLFSCSEPSCTGKSKTFGSIKEEVVISCITQFDTTHFVIQNDSSFQHLFVDSLQVANCSLPEIDFASYTLLGFYTDAQCNMKSYKTVSIDESSKTLTYHIENRSCGACKALVYSYNWILVDKIDSTYTVEFKLN